MHLPRPPEGDPSSPLCRRSGHIASLPWYDLAEVRWANDALWTAIARRLRQRGFRGVPAALDRSTAYEALWDEDALLLSQACGYDVLLAHRGKLRLVATPCYDAPGCRQHTYSSLVTVADGSPFHQLAELRGTRCVINTATSHSGMNILRAVVAPLHESGRFFATVTVSGSHERSLDLIRSGEADVAALDCVVAALLAQHRPQALRGLRFIHRTAACPAPPFVTTSSATDDEVLAIRAAIVDALAAPELADAKRALRLRRVRALSLAAYDAIGELEGASLALGSREFPACLAAASRAGTPQPGTLGYE